MNVLREVKRSDLTAAFRPARAIALVAVITAWLGLASVLAWRGQPLTGDEAILLSASESLVERGRLGAPIFAGVHEAGNRYYLSPPLAHVMHWPVMKWSGVTVESARGVSVAAGVAILLGSACLAFRMGGGFAAVVAAWLLVFWRSGLIGTGVGIPLVAVTRSIRYDVLVLAWVVVGLVLMEWWLRSGRRVAAGWLGFVSAAALLTHWTGLVLPAGTVAAWLLAGRHAAGRPRLTSLVFVMAWMVAGLTPWAVAVMRDLPTVVGQWSLVHGSRAEAAVGGAGALLSNLMREPLRFRGILEAGGPGAAGVLVSALALWRMGARDPGASGTAAAAVLGVGLAAVVILALFEPTKAPLYALVLVVPLALATAVGASAIARSGRRRAGAFLALGLLVVTAEGLVATVRDVRAAGAARPYAEVAATLTAATRDGVATGPLRWWWALRADGYVPVSTLVLRSAADDRGGVDSALDVVWRGAGIRYLIWSEEQEADQSRWTPPVRRFLERVRACGRTVVRTVDRTYGTLEVIDVPDRCVAAQ